MRANLNNAKEMPRPKSDNTFQVAFKIPKTWVDLADRAAKKLSQPGMTVTRTDALRMALLKGLQTFAAVREGLVIEPNHYTVLELVVQSYDAGAQPHARDYIAQLLQRKNIGPQELPVARTLSELSTMKLIERRGAGFVPTEEGRTVLRER